MRRLGIFVALLATIVLWGGSSDAVEKHKERDHSTVAAVDTAAPRTLTLIAGPATLVDNAIYRAKFENSFRIRGIVTSIDVVDSSKCDLILKVNGVTQNTFSMVGKNDKANYIALGPHGDGIDVPAGQEVSLTTDLSGTNSGLIYALDIVP